MIIIVLCLLLQLIDCQVYNLEDNFICQGVLCNVGNYTTNVYNYGVESFGDLTGQQFQLSFHIQLASVPEEQYIFSIMQGSNSYMSIVAMYGSPTQVEFTINTNQIFYINTANWYQVILNNTHVSICDYKQSINLAIQFTLPPMPRFNFFLQDSTNYWRGIGYGITLYKGFSSSKAYLLQNMLQPETILDINIQELKQHNITVDYSQYELVNKLGQKFNWDVYDPYLIENSLLFNGSQFIYIKDPNLKRETFSIEFRLEQSQIFSSSITLFNYTYLNNYQLLIFLNGTQSIGVKLNGQTMQYPLIQHQVIHICIGVLHNLELNLKYFQLCFIQLSNTGILQLIEPTNFTYYTSSSVFKSGNGDLFIGSLQNQFSSGQYIKLFHMRIYLGFFFDDQGIIDPLCKFYLNDRCILCIGGYVLTLEHNCKLECTSSILLTWLVQSHNQCLRLCSPICSTCSPSDPLVCLQCNGIRILPPQCKCPAGYFEDGISPNCRKYFPEMQTQIGFIQTWYNNTNDIYTPIVFDRPYESTPSVAIFYTGYKSVNRTIQHLHSDRSSISLTGFTAKTRFSEAEYFQVYWISSIGNYKFIPQTSVWYPTLTNQNYTITGPTLKNNVPFVTFPHMQDFNNNITTAVNGEFKLQITKATNTIYNVKSTGYYLRLNFIQNNFVSYLFDSPNHTAVVSFSNIPKSVQSLVIINGLISPVRLGFQLRQKYRNSTTYQFFNTHKITNINGNVLFLAQQCYNTVQPCDFYTSYITSCSMQYSFCNCLEDGHYLNSTNECDQCSLNCGNCVGTKTNCTSCNPSQFKTFVSNNCICTGKRFLDASSNICQSCDFRCLTCNGALMTNCLTCHPDQSLTPQKECVCPSRKYFDQILLICLCIYFLITDCLDRQFVDNTLSVCVYCQYSCSTCDQGDKCLTCPTSRQMIGTNQFICKNGYYENYNLECLKCKQECDTCENQQNCTSCIDTQKVLIDGSCYCPDGFCDNPQTSICWQCQFPCVKCIGLQICTQCQHNMILTNQKCICPLDMYLSQNNICALCSPSCDTCFGPNVNQCKSCGLNSFFKNNQCLCKSGYFNHNNLCTKCDSSCTECVDGSHCLSCSFNRYFDIRSNICKCQQGYFESEDSFCKSCELQCKACNNSDICTECWPNQILNQDKCVCNQGFYLESNTCLSCNDELAKFNDQCKVLDCSDGVWSPFEECDDGNQIYRDGCSQCLIDPQYQCVNVVRQKSLCFQCQENCLYCDQSQCQECYDGYFLYKNNCIRCSQQCQTCINTPSQCLKCAINDQIPDQNYHCQGCSIGYFLQDSQCIQKCGDGIKTPLEECDDGNLLGGDGCNQFCQIEPQHYCYQDNLQSVCLSTRLEVFLQQIYPLSSDSYFVQIESSKMIQFTNLELQIKSDHINQEIFTYNSTYLNSSQQLKILQINCTIKFYQSIDLIVLRFIINGKVQNNMKQPLHINPINYSFQNILCMTAYQKDITGSMNKQASYQIKGTILLLIVRILIFGIGQSSRMVRVNNIASFIKYIDIQIPPNYLEFLIELEGLNLINNLYITQLIDMTKLLPQTVIEYIEPGKELNKFKNNTGFIINVLPFMINLIACYLLIRYFQLQTLAIKKLIQKLYHKNIYSINSTVYKILVWLEIYSRKLYVETSSQGYQELYLAFEYNICFFISLQLIGLNLSTNYDLINLTFAIGFLMHFIRQLQQKLTNKFQFGSRAFNIIMILDPYLYIACIVFLNNYTLCQLLIIQVSQILMILSLIKQPFQQSLFYYQILVEEVFLLLTFKSFLIYIYFPIELDYILIGFIQMGFLLLIFTANSCIQIYELIQKLKQFYQQHQRKLQKQREKQKKNIMQLVQLQQ